VANKPKPKQKEPAKARPRTPAGKGTATIQARAAGRGAARRRSRTSSTLSWDRALEWIGGVLAGLLVLAVGMGFDSRIYALYFTPRMLYFFLAAILFILTWVLVARPGLRRVRLDWIDGAGLALVLWEVVTATAAPIPNLAWFGTYNRTSGAFMWIALILVFLGARRLLDGTRALRPLVWAAVFVLVLNAILTLTQATGGTTPWGGVDLSNGRMTGTSGNPVNTAGLCLLAVWLGGLAFFGGELPRWSRRLAGLGALSGLVPIVLAVSRAAYIGLGVAAVLLAAVFLLRHRWRSVAVLGAVAVLVAAGTVAYSARSGGHIASLPVSAVTQDASTPATAQEAAKGPSLGDSDAQRVEFWKVALDAVQKRPLLGYGPGAYASAYRLFVPAARLQAEPTTVVSDPHDFPLLVASTIGIPGLLLTLALLGGGVVVLALRAAKSLWRREAEPGGGRATIGLVFALAVLAYLMVSPTDLVTMVPLMLVLGAALGQGSEHARLSVMLPAVQSRKGVGQAVTGVLAVACTVALVVALVMGVRAYQADIASAQGTKLRSVEEAVRAGERFPWYPHYLQVAGGMLWRRAVTQDAAQPNKADAKRGEEMIKMSLAYDPGQVLARADLARYYLTSQHPGLAAEQLLLGLPYCPNSPILQGILGYSSYSAVVEAHDATVAKTTSDALRALPPTVADGWYWLSEALRAQGDVPGAEAALARATGLGPTIKPADYERRIQGG
jgi:O-antigen ligase